MKTKVASAVVVGGVAIASLFWFAFVRAPDPTEVCEHINALALREAEQDGPPSLVGSLRDSCVERKRAKIEERGRIKWAPYARCVVSKGTLAEIDDC